MKSSGQGGGVIEVWCSNDLKKSGAQVHAQKYVGWPSTWSVVSWQVEAVDARRLQLVAFQAPNQTHPTQICVSSWKIIHYQAHIDVYVCVLIVDRSYIIKLI